jgi:hypothetical protein
MLTKKEDSIKRNFFPFEKHEPEELEENVRYMIQRIVIKLEKNRVITHLEGKCSYIMEGTLKTKLGNVIGYNSFAIFTDIKVRHNSKYLKNIQKFPLDIYMVNKKNDILYIDDVNYFKPGRLAVFNCKKWKFGKPSDKLEEYKILNKKTEEARNLLLDNTIKNLPYDVQLIIYSYFYRK